MTIAAQNGWFGDVLHLLTAPTVHDVFCIGEPQAATPESGTGEDTSGHVPGRAPSCAPGGVEPVTIERVRLAFGRLILGTEVRTGEADGADLEGTGTPAVAASSPHPVWQLCWSTSLLSCVICVHDP